MKSKGLTPKSSFQHRKRFSNIFQHLAFPSNIFPTLPTPFQHPLKGYIVDYAYFNKVLEVLERFFAKYVSIAGNF
jgi:hypothetical protein